MFGHQTYEETPPLALLADWLCRDVMLEERGLIEKAPDCSSQHLPNKEGLVMEDKQSGRPYCVFLSEVF